MIQGNIAQRDKWDRRQSRAIMQTYADLTASASQKRPDLIIWPETATPRSISLDLSLRNQVVRIARESGSWLLVGSAERQKFETGRKADLQFYNTAFLIAPSPGTAIQRYEKIHLFPFGEYLPWQGIFPWSVLNVENAGNYLPGKTFTVFTCGDFRFGVTICWEILYPGLSRISIRDGAQLMVNITNEAWFGRTIAPYLVVTGAVFRAIENRVYVARCANTSLTCFIDPHGRIVDRVADDNGEELFVRGVLTGTIVPMDAKTPYTRFGNWLVWLSLGVVGLAGLWRNAVR
jgi:apolipoprotein N-acyltransferase